jgi:hypothetical protein
MSRSSLARCLIAVAAVAAVLAVAGCSTRSAGSALGAGDPAQIVPAGAPAYVSFTVRPGGSEATTVNRVLQEFGITSTMVARTWNSLLRKSHPSGLTYQGDIAPWLGREVAVTLVATPSQWTSSAVSNDVAAIASVTNVTAARAFITKINDHATDAHAALIGGFVVLGSPALLSSLRSVQAVGSLADSSAFQNVESQLGSGELMTAYAALKPLLSGLAQASDNPTESSALAKLPADATAAAGLSATSGSIRLDLLSHDTGSSEKLGTASVAGLPAGSWLALAVGASPVSMGRITQLDQEFDRAFQQKLQAGVGATRFGAIGARLERSVTKTFTTIFGALGPVQLAVTGSSPLASSVGAELTSPTAKGAQNLIEFVADSIGTSAAGLSAKSGSLTIPAGPLGTLHLQRQGRRIFATSGSLTPQTLVSPASTLASNSAYQKAAATLPSGSKVQFYLSFAPIKALLSLIRTGEPAQASRVLRSLDNVVAGGVPGHYRLVLNLSS